LREAAGNTDGSEVVEKLLATLKPVEQPAVRRLNLAQKSWKKITALTR
jgi:hypothetical protein